MKNKKGFTLVELLAVIVILALIMGIAIVGIGNVITSSKEQVMLENAQAMIDGVKKQFAIYGEEPNGKVYGFSSAILESGGVTSPLGGNFAYGSKGTNDKEITTGLWQITGTAPTCSATANAFISVSSSGAYTICLAAGTGNKYVSGTEANISADLANKTTNTILPNS